MTQGKGKEQVWDFPSHIIYNIVRDLGGNIEFHVDEGFGTTFILTFPKI